MKIERRVKASALWEWLQDKLPSGLKPVKVSIGYGYAYGLYQPGGEPGWVARQFDQIGDPVAIVTENCIELHHPQWMSDFEDLLRRYESEKKVEARLIYWEGGHG